jgi:predicted MFS family arabinose efflux permease
MGGGPGVQLELTRVAQPASSRPAAAWRSTQARKALTFGWRSARGLMALWGGLLLPLPSMASMVGLGLWLTAAGFFLALLSATLTYRLQQALPPARQVEGFSLYSACWALGIALGIGLAGALLDGPGPGAVLVAASLAPLVAAASASLLSLRRVDPAPER